MAQKRKQYLQLSPDALAKTGAILGLIFWALGIFWHGGMGQPSMMSLMYGMPYMSSAILVNSFLLLVVGGFVAGWLGAAIYNRLLGR